MTTFITEIVSAPSVQFAAHFPVPVTADAGELVDCDRDCPYCYGPETD